jgi:hypothetical protein
MKKVTEGKDCSLVNISESEFESIKSAFTLMVRSTANEQASEILKLLQEKGNLLEQDRNQLQTQRKKRSKITQ